MVNHLDWLLRFILLALHQLQYAFLAAGRDDAIFFSHALQISPHFYGVHWQKE